MLRIISQRLYSTGRTNVALRPLSTTSSLNVKIRRPDGTTSTPSTASNNGNAASGPSPAENAPKPPPDISTPPPPFEPKVNAPSQPASNPAASETSTASNIPLTPPAAEPEAPPAKRDLRNLPSLDVDSELARLAKPEPKKGEEQEGEGASGASGKRRTGAGRKEYVSSIERQRRTLLRYGIGALIVGGVGAAYFTGQDDAAKSSEGQYERVKQNVTEFFDIFNKPAFKTLLPDPLPPPHQRPYTLLIDLEGMLVTSTWDRTHGWRTAKRPGVDYFLAYLSQFYEIVLFTHQPLYTAAPVAEKLDPFQAYLPYKLFRDSTRSVDGKTVKDLTYLNRDLSKVIMLDTNPEHAALQPENAIIIPTWEGKGGEQGLVELIPFLESIAFYNVKDVRPTLKAYQGKDIATEYAKIEAEQKRVATQEWERLHPNAVHGVGSGFLTSMFGSVASPGRQRPNQPQTYIEQKRAEAQRVYQEEQKYWKDHAEEFAKLIEEDKQRQLAEMKGSLWNFMSGGTVVKPEEKKQE